MRCTICNQVFKDGDLVDVAVRKVEWADGISLNQMGKAKADTDYTHHRCASAALARGPEKACSCQS